MKCAYCGKPFVLANSKANPLDDKLYCSTICAKLADTEGPKALNSPQPDPWDGHFMRGTWDL